MHHAHNTDMSRICPCKGQQEVLGEEFTYSQFTDFSSKNYYIQKGEIYFYIIQESISHVLRHIEWFISMSIAFRYTAIFFNMVRICIFKIPLFYFCTLFLIVSKSLYTILLFYTAKKIIPWRRRDGVQARVHQRRGHRCRGESHSQGPNGLNQYQAWRCDRRGPENGTIQSYPRRCIDETKSSSPVTLWW